MSKNYEKKEGNNNDNNKIEEKTQNQRLSRSRNSSPNSDRSNKNNAFRDEEKDKSNGINNKQENNMSTLEQILDDDFITGQIPPNETSKTVNNFVENNENKNLIINNNNGNNENITEPVDINDYEKNNEMEISKKEETSDNHGQGDESFYNKLKVDELKSELKKKNINFPKNARKNELIELLVKNISG